MDRLHAKIIAGVVMLVSILACFLLPIKLSVYFRRRGDNGQYYLDLLACFAGGVFLAVYLIFMAPAVRELILENLMKPHQIEYPLPDVLIGVGFFILLFLNRSVVSFSKMTKKRKNKLKEKDVKLAKSSSTVTTELSRESSNGKLISNGDSFHQMPSVSSTNCFDDEMKSEPIVITVDPDDPDYGQRDPNNPYPLPRRSSITDVAHQDSMTRSIIMMLALSLDSVFEGITTGLKTTTVEVWAIFVGNMVHETVIAFCLGLQLVRVNESSKQVVIAAIAYSLMNPVGLAVATFFYEMNGSSSQIDLISGLLQGLTSGCFIYVTFCEILEGQITHKTSWAKIFSMLMGFVMLSAFAAVPGSSSYSVISDERFIIGNLSLVNDTIS